MSADMIEYIVSEHNIEIDSHDLKRVKVRFRLFPLVRLGCIMSLVPYGDDASLYEHIFHCKQKIHPFLQNRVGLHWAMYLWILLVLVYKGESTFM